jgi:hypothetical protein
LGESLDATRHVGSYTPVVFLLQLALAVEHKVDILRLKGKLLTQVTKS